MTDLGTLIAGGIGLAGVALGVWLNNRAEWRRWRRDWIISRVTEIRTHFADVIEPVNQQSVLGEQAREQMLGLRVPVPPERIQEAGARWARALARSVVESPVNVQLALARLDQARNDVAVAVNARRIMEADAAITKFSAARVEVLTEMNSIVNAMNEDLVQYLFPMRKRVWARVRRRPLYTHVPLGDPQPSPATWERLGDTSESQAPPPEPTAPPTREPGQASSTP